MIRGTSFGLLLPWRQLRGVGAERIQYFVNVLGGPEIPRTFPRNPASEAVVMGNHGVAGSERFNQRRIGPTDTMPMEVSASVKIATL